MSSKEILGIHHVTAIAGDPQVNIDFYTGVLGLRMVKLTVNYDDPTTYHLYYGDQVGHPGTILTFFPWPGAPKGRRGTGQLTTTSFSIPQGSMGYWIERLKQHHVDTEGPFNRLNEEALMFYDRDDLQLELVSHQYGDARAPWADGPVPIEHAVRGFYGISLSEEGYERTAALLANTLGFKLIAQEGSLFRYAVGSGGPGSIVDVLCVPDQPPGRVAVGTVHHVAYRTPDDEQQKIWRQDIADSGYDVTPIINRNYFHSIYFREPGGVLFEIATDPPGFTIDEPLSQLGTHLQLPPWLEPMREQIETRLPKLRPVEIKTAA